MNSPNHLKFWFKKARLPLAVAFILGGSGVYAFPAPTSLESEADSFRRTIELISQNSQPPEVIINDPNSPGSPPPPTSNRNGDTRFTCEVINGEYTVVYYPESQPDRGYPWAIPSQLGGNWSPQRRCNEITNRLENYHQDGLLEMSTGVENNYNVVCVTTQIDPTDCRIVLTVPPGQDPQLTRNLIFENLLIADDGQQTQGVYTYGNNRTEKDILNDVGSIIGVEGLGGNNSNKNKTRRTSGNIDLRPFLDPADGGTGQQLTKGRAITSPPSNPSSRSTSSPRKPALFR